jgi:hypothetical protein
VNRERIAEALRQVAGHPLSLQFELSEDGAHDGSLNEEEAIRRIVDAFDAEDVLEEGPGDLPTTR